MARLRRTAALPAPLRLLILGGTTEGSHLARALAGREGIEATVSLAGRTTVPIPLPLRTRTGGFGGVDGLAAALTAERFDAVIDATHPFASRISANARAACARLALPLATFTRPPWRPDPGDRWIEVPDLAAAALALGPVPRRVFLTTGRLGLAAFRAAPQHDYLVRTIDPPDAGDLPPRARVLLARGPFSAEDETALMRDEAITVLVTKNSGGAAGEAKLLAAQGLGLPVVMVRPPERPRTSTLVDLDAALAWIAALQRPTP